MLYLQFKKIPAQMWWLLFYTHTHTHLGLRLANAKKGSGEEIPKKKTEKNKTREESSIFEEWEKDDTCQI